MRLTITSILLLTLVVAPFTARAQEDAAAQARPAPVAHPRLENLVPDSTMLFMSLNDVPTMASKWSRTALAKLWREPEVQQFVAPLLELLDRELTKAEKKMGHPIRDLFGFMAGQVALAVVDFDPSSGASPDWALLADLGERRAEFQGAHRKAVADASEKLQVMELEHKGVAYQSLTTRRGYEIAVAYLGECLAASYGRDRMNAMIDAYLGTPFPSLAGNDNFRAVSEETGGGDAFFQGFANVEAGFAKFGEWMEPLVARGVDAAGLTGVRGIGFGMNFTAEGVRDTIFVHAPGEKKGLIKMMYTSPGPGIGLLRRVPKKAFYASAGRADFAEMMDIAMDAVGEVEPAALDEVLAQLGRAEEFLGLDIREDILRPFGEEMALYAALPEAGGLIPDIVFLSRLRDPARFQASLEHLVAKLKMVLEDRPRLAAEHRKMDYMGKTIHYLHVSHKWGDPIPVTPAFLVEGELMAMALVPSVLKDFIARSADAPSLFDRPDFQRVMKGLPDGLTSVEYVDFGAAARLIYGTLLPIAQAAGKDQDVPLDFALMPRTETIAKHLFGAAWGMKADDAGISMHAYSPTGIGPLVATLAVPVMFLGLRTARYETAEVMAVPREAEPAAPVPAEPVAPARASTRGHLEEIYSGLLYYYLAKGDTYPSDLGALVTSKVVAGPGVLVVPEDASPAATASGHKTSFVYLGPAVGHLAKDEHRAVWVYERDGLGKGARWVLFGSGAVRRVPEPEFQELLKETKARLAK